jgi:hypothetical protein
MSVRVALLVVVLCVCARATEEKSAGTIGIDITLGVMPGERWTRIKPALQAEPYVRFVRTGMVDVGLAGLLRTGLWTYADNDPEISNTGFLLLLDLGPKLCVTPGVVGGEVALGPTLQYERWTSRFTEFDLVDRYRLFQFGTNVSAGPVLMIASFRFRALFRHRLLVVSVWGARSADVPMSNPNSYDEQIFQMRLEPSVLLGAVAIRAGCVFSKTLTRWEDGDFTDWGVARIEYQPFVGILIGR